LKDTHPGADSASHPGAGGRKEAHSINAQDHQRHQGAGRPVRSQPSPGAVETHGGTALEGRGFYVWEEDRQAAVEWANELAAAAPPPARTDRAGG
jgi:hypothetical protein